MTGININLLPEDFRENIGYSKKNKRALTYVKGIVLMFILVICSFIICGFALYENDKFFKVSRQESDKTIGEYSPIMDEKKKIETKAETIKSIKSGYKYWSKFNYILSQTTPEGVYLSSLETDSGNVKISGYSKTKEELGVFRDALERDEAFSSVNITSVKVVSDPLNQDVSVNSFALTLKLGNEGTSRGQSNERF